MNIYAYVWDSNKQVDIFGLAVIGLGLDNNLINHRGTGAIIYKNAGWQTAGLTKVDWGRASIDNYYFWESFKESAKNAEQIRFDISDFDMNYSKNSITKKEMEYILSNSEILEKTIFIKDGKEMVWNNKGFFECK